MKIGFKAQTSTRAGAQRVLMENVLLTIFGTFTAMLPFWLIWAIVEYRWSVHRAGILEEIKAAADASDWDRAMQIAVDSGDKQLIMALLTGALSDLDWVFGIDEKP